MLPLKLVCNYTASGDPKDAPCAPRPPRLLQDPDEQIDVPRVRVDLAEAADLFRVHVAVEMAVARMAAKKVKKIENRMKYNTG